MCHMSHVTCHMSHVVFFGQSGEAYRWRVCYQRGGPPRLVSAPLEKYESLLTLLSICFMFLS
jgi:hypothetical protein